MNNLLYVCFNRPDLVQKSLKKILEIKWDNILIVIDGGRNDSEKVIVNETINLVYSLTNNLKNCRIVIRNINYGCRRNLELIIKEFFSEFRKGWVFEDDILLTDIKNFNNLRENWKLKGHLALYNPVEFDFDKPVKINNGHYLIWGWYLDSDTLPNFRNRITFKSLKNIFYKRGLFHGIKFIFLYIKTLLNIIDTWDSIYTAWCIEQNISSYILPEPLIKNIGFDNRATHTLNEPKKTRNIGAWNEKKWNKIFKTII